VYKKVINDLYKKGFFNKHDVELLKNLEIDLVYVPFESGLVEKGKFYYKSWYVNIE
jgi:hypothetical protein